MYVCVCAAVTEAELRTCIGRGAQSVDELGDACGAGTGCGSCHHRIEVLLTTTGSPADLAGLPRSA